MKGLGGLRVSEVSKGMATPGIFLDKMSNEELLKEIREKSRQAASGFLQPHIDKIEAEILKRMDKTDVYSENLGEELAGM